MHIRYNETSDLYEYLASVGPEVWLTLPINGSQITAGSIADARLSSNIPLKNAANTFSATGNIFSEILRTDKGIKFPATEVPAADVNTLTDYERGDWTPTYTGSSGATGVTYLTRLGKYVKIGDFVYVYFNVQVNNKGTITGAGQITGLPFAVTNVSGYVPVGQLYWGGLGTGLVHALILAISNTTVLLMYGIATAAVSLNPFTDAAMANSANIAGTMVYRAA